MRPDPAERPASRQGHGRRPPGPRAESRPTAAAPGSRRRRRRSAAPRPRPGRSTASRAADASASSVERAVRGWSPRRMNTPSRSCVSATAAMPSRSELDNPRLGSGLTTRRSPRHSMPANASTSGGTTTTVVTGSCQLERVEHVLEDGSAVERRDQLAATEAAACPGREHDGAQAERAARHVGDHRRTVAPARSHRRAYHHRVDHRPG